MMDFHHLKGLFHPACLARVMGHENGKKQRLSKRRNVQGMLDETDPLMISISLSLMSVSFLC